MSTPPKRHGDEIDQNSIISPHVGLCDNTILLSLKPLSSFSNMASPTAVFRANATALITGAASGVGLAVAKLCASHSMNLILVDRDTSKLDDAKSSISSKGNVDTHPMDVSSLSDWSALKYKVEQSGEKLDFLHLNAGIGAKGDWTDNAYFHKIFDTNLYVRSICKCLAQRWNSLFEIVPI